MPLIAEIIAIRVESKKIPFIIDNEVLVSVTGHIIRILSGNYP